jgi:hypothetical protein
MKSQPQPPSNAESSSSLNLADLEKIVAKEPEAFFRACDAMRAIIEGGLYKDSYPSLERYLKERFGMSRSRGYQLADCARVMENLSTTVGTTGLPRNERQVRQLVKFPMDEQCLRWLDICNGGSNSIRSEPKSDRWERLLNGLMRKYDSWPDGEKLMFIETVAELMARMRQEFEKNALKNKNCETNSAPNSPLSVMQ